jgi:FAD/FMN-containing dehydrogenase
MTRQSRSPGIDFGGTTRRRFIGAGSVALVGALAQPTRTAAGLSAASISPPAKLSGRVIWPQDPEYGEARLDFNARLSRFPAAIVICDDARDVQNAIRWAREEGVPLCARSGGHSYEAFSTVDGGLVIDVSGLDRVVVDARRGEARVGSGVRLLDLYRRLHVHGLTLSAGTCPSVGIAGLTLGGGFGFLSRQDGLTCDNLLAVDLVNADSDVLRISNQEHPDLFWALRGGGAGNFGIATAFTFRLRAIEDVALLRVTWPWHDLGEVLDTWQRWAPTVDERLVPELHVPDSRVGMVTSVGQFAGAATELEDLVRPLLQVGTPSSPQVWSVPFLTAVEYFAGPEIAHSTFKNTGAFAYEPFSSEAIATLIEQMRASPSERNLVGLYPFGGAIAAIDPAATAFVHRRALFNLQYQAFWDDPADAQANVAWVRDIRKAMLPYTTGTYVNFVDSEITDWATAYYGANLPRLMRIKAVYDPNNVFGGPQSIPLPTRSGLQGSPASGTPHPLT